MDTCGFPKDNFYYYQAWWSDKPVLHLFPHWNWPGKEGQEIGVWCHSNLGESRTVLERQDEQAAALRRQLPQLLAKFAGVRAGRVLPPGYRSAHFARPGILTGEGYDPQLGFGMATEEVPVGTCYAVREFGMNEQYWHSTSRVAYRIDGLDCKARYRLGVTLYDSNSNSRRVAVAVARASDGKKVVLAGDVAEPSLNRGQRPLLAWYDIPAEMIDPQGIVLEVGCLEGDCAVRGVLARAASR